MKKRLIIISLVFILFNLLIYSNYIINNLFEYTNLFIKNLFFYTFIIYIISSLLIDNDLLKLLNPISFVTIISMISGFPSGVKYTRELLNKNYINIDTANYLVTFCHFPNPLFIIGSVSTLVDKKNALFILFSIYISSFITSRFFKNKFNIIISQNYNNSKINFMTSFNNAITNAFKTIIIIYGSSIISIIVVLIIIRMLHPTGVLYCIINGIFDLTKGIFSTALINNKKIRLTLILSFITFGSLNIHLQSKSICNNTDINYKYFIKGRIITTIIVLTLNIVYSLLG